MDAGRLFGNMLSDRRRRRHLPSTRERADLLLSFGRLTLPHMLMRAVLAEQIYRIQTIINHHPYHRE